MTHEEAKRFLAPLEINKGEIWADLGAGSGTFTRVLAEQVGQVGQVHAIDRHKGSLEQQALLKGDLPIALHHQDFSNGLHLQNLDGILLANSLHYIRRQQYVLGKHLKLLKPMGKLIVLEYDRRLANPWIPFPVSREKLTELAKALKLPEPIVVNEKASRYGNGTLYLAVMRNG